MLVALAPVQDRPVSPPPSVYPFAETPLVVAFAAVERPADLSGRARLPLAELPELSPHDAWLVLPLRARTELVPAFARGATGRLAQWLDDALVVRGEIDHRRLPALHLQEEWAARDVLAGHTGPRVSLASSGNPARAINQLPGVRALSPSGLVDASSLAVLTERTHFAGLTREDVFDPAFVWCERVGSEVRVRAALVPGDDAPVALLAPFTLALR